MQDSEWLLTWAVVLASLVLVSCDSGQGPLLINLSGQSVRLHVS